MTIDLDSPCHIQSGILPSPRDMAASILAKAPKGAAGRIQHTIAHAAKRGEETAYVEYYKAVLSLIPPIQ